MRRSRHQPTCVQAKESAYQLDYIYIYIGQPVFWASLLSKKKKKYARLTINRPEQMYRDQSLYANQIATYIATNQSNWFISSHDQ